MIYRQLLAFFLSFALIFSTTSALAASPAGWSATVADAAMSGAAVTIKAFKGNGAAAKKAVISYAPTVTKVASELVKIGGGLALAYAMSQLLDAGIDWVLDPENNRVKYLDTSGVIDPQKPAEGYPLGTVFVTNGGCSAAAYNPEASCAMAGKIWGKPAFYNANSSSGNKCQVAGLGNYNTSINNSCTVDPAAGADGLGEEKYISLDTVAAQVIADAAAGSDVSANLVKSIAVGAANSGDLDAALDAAAESTTENQTADPVAPVEPVKPFDPSGILDALKKILSALGLLSVLGTISDSLTSMFEWFKSEPDKPEKPEDNEIDIPEQPLPNIDSAISFGGACPADLGADFNLYGTNFNFVLMPFSKLCPLLSTFVKPTLILLGSFMAVAIVGGRKDA